MRSLITTRYGFAMPDDFLAFWEFANTVTIPALTAALDIIALEGPFDLLRDATASDPWWQARHYHDPPEFFTVLSGLTDGLHWGYYLDDPASGRFAVASYYSNDAFVVRDNGATLFAALRYEMELHYRDCLEFVADDPTEADSYKKQIAQIDTLRAALQRYATADRPETGEAYAERYGSDSARHPIAPTRDGMGIVAPPATYRALAGGDPFSGWDYQPTPVEAQAMADAALAALAAGSPATALKVGKDLWSYDKHADLSYHLLDAAYMALDRPLLRHYLARARQHRDWLLAH